MKILAIIITLATIHAANGQSANQNDLVEILNGALRDNKLPDELINKSNPKIAPWTNAPFIVVKSDTTKKLGRLSDPSSMRNVLFMDHN